MPWMIESEKGDIESSYCIGDKQRKKKIILLSPFQKNYHISSLTKKNCSTVSIVLKKNSPYQKRKPCKPEVLRSFSLCWREKKLSSTFSRISRLGPPSVSLGIILISERCKEEHGHHRKGQKHTRSPEWCVGTPSTLRYLNELIHFEESLFLSTSSSERNFSL